MTDFRIPYRPDISNKYLNLFFGNYDFNFKVYKRFLQIQNYFAGLYEQTKEDNNFEEIETKFFKWLWTYGEIFVTYFNEQFQLWSIINKKVNGMYIEEVEAQLIFDNYSYATPNNFKKATFKNGIHGIYVTYNSAQPLAAIVFWWDYICNLVDLEKRFLNNTIWDSKKFIYYQNNGDDEIKNLETSSFTNSDSPFIVNVSPISLAGKSGQAQNIIQKIDSGTSMSDQAYNNLLNYQNYVWNCMGMMAPNELKKERKTTSEANLDTYNTLNIEQLTLRELKKFSKKAKELWNIDLDFDLTTNLKEMTNNQNIDSASKIKGGNNNEKV